MRKIIIPLTYILFILISEPYFKFTLSLFYLIFSLFYGLKIKIIPNILLFVTIVIISILSPRGIVLFSAFNFPITKGAILSGIFKSSFLIGTIYLSRIFTSETIKIPGRIGELTSNVFFYFNQLLTGNKITYKNFIEDIDSKLLNLSHTKDIIDKNNKKTNFYPIFFVTAIIFMLDMLQVSL